MTTLTHAKLVEARRLREEQDMSYADIAENLGFPRDQWSIIRAAMQDLPAGDAAPTDALAELEAKAAELLRTAEADHGSMDAAIRASHGDRPLTPAELASIERIYASGAPITFEEIGKALVPPVHWLTVSNAIADMGWVRPGYKLPPRSTATEEGELEQAREAASLAARTTASLHARELVRQHPHSLAQAGIGGGEEALMSQQDAHEEALERQARVDDAAARAAAVTG